MRLVGVAVVAILACSSAAPGRGAEAAVRPAPERAAAGAVPPAPDAGTALQGYPLARLNVAGNPVEPLDHAVAPALLAGVRSHRAFTATTPRVWLLVFEFADAAALRAGQARIEAGLGEPPHYVKSTATGTWLLVTGFPGEKPVSPEMEAARTEFLSRWAGEE